MRMRGSANMDMGTQSVDFNSTSNDVLAVQGEYETYANQPLLIMDGFEISIQTLADMDPDRVASIVFLRKKYRLYLMRLRTCIYHRVKGKSSMKRPAFQ